MGPLKSVDQLYLVLPVLKKVIKNPLKKYFNYNNISYIYGETTEKKEN